MRKPILDLGGRKTQQAFKICSVGECWSHLAALVMGSLEDISPRISVCRGVIRTL